MRHWLTPVRTFLAAGFLTAQPAMACETALVLTIDVSGSIDFGEYLIQAEGIADALTDPEVAEMLEIGQVALAVVQWSGAGQQHLSIPWRRMLNAGEIAGFAGRVRAMPRAFQGSDTAVGEAVEFSLGLFEQVSDCRRKTIDISGDGPSNSSIHPSGPRMKAEAMGVFVNGVAIESIGRSISEFYRRFVITDGGFVMSAEGHSQYARTIRAKILRELAQPIG
ncbi:MAG: DUF1194 domain-containing protein [Paracoccaceae bacterium]